MVASHSLTNNMLYVLLCIFCALSLLSQTISARTVYDRTKLLSIKESCQDYAFGKYDYIPTEILHPPQLVGVGIIPTERRRRLRRERRLKRGKRVGLLPRLQANPYKPPLPSLFLVNSQSLINKMDEIHLRITSRSINSCIMIMTETWLSSAILDAAIELEGHVVYRADRTADPGKRKGGGVCEYMY